ncbi:MAG: glycosyltransferase [Victivallaceae bacterium]|nr:glycosyltransferase [Victivallaceae bacterium]
MIASFAIMPWSWKQMFASKSFDDMSVLGMPFLIFCCVLSALTVLYFLMMALLAFFYKRFPSVSDDDLPVCSVLVPAFNEGSNILTALNSIMASDYPVDKLEIIAINDGSEDDTWSWIEKAVADSNGRIKSINLVQNGGKKHALYHGIKIARGEVVVTVDSDSEVTPGALRELMAPFAFSDVGGVSGNIRVKNTADGMIPLMLDTGFVFGFDFIRESQSVVNGVLCTPGALSAYRRSAVLPLLDEWLNQKFMGLPSRIGEDRAITSLLIREHFRVVYQDTALGYTLMPTTYRRACKMLIRWTRSDVRENLQLMLAVIGDFSSFDRIVLQINLFMMSIGILSPLIFLPAMAYNLIFNPDLFFCYTVLPCVLWSLTPAMMYARHFRKSESVWAFCFGVYAMFALTWICVYALFTARNSAWLTRSRRETAGERRGLALKARLSALARLWFL